MARSEAQAPRAASGGGTLLPESSTSLELERRTVGRLVVTAPTAASDAVRRIEAAQQLVLYELERNLDVRLAGPVEVVLLPAPSARGGASAELAAWLDGIDRLAPPWAAAFNLKRSRLVVLRLGAVDRRGQRDLVAVLAHELCHQLIGDGAPGADIPRWLEEGFCVRFSGDFFGRMRPWSHLARGARRQPSLSQLDFSTARGATASYRKSSAFVGWLTDQHGDDVLAGLLRDARHEGAAWRLDSSWRRLVGESLRETEERWNRWHPFFRLWLPWLLSPHALWMGIVLLFLLATWLRYRRRRAQEELWRLEEEAEELAREKLLSSAQGGPETETVH